MFASGDKFVSRNLRRNFISGFVAVFIAGYELEMTKSWTVVFNQTAVVCCLGWIVYLLFGTGKKIVWPIVSELSLFAGYLVGGWVLCLASIVIEGQFFVVWPIVFDCVKVDRDPPTSRKTKNLERPFAPSGAKCSGLQNLKTKSEVSPTHCRNVVQLSTMQHQNGCNLVKNSHFVSRSSFLHQTCYPRWLSVFRGSTVSCNGPSCVKDFASELSFVSAQFLLSVTRNSETPLLEVTASTRIFQVKVSFIMFCPLVEKQLACAILLLHTKNALNCVQLPIMMKDTLTWKILVSVMASEPSLWSCI